MKMQRIMWAALFCLLMISAASSAMAQAKPLIVDLAHNRVDITTGFNGTRVVLFGTASEPDSDIVVTLMGPQKTMVMRRKGHVMGAWINRSSVEFRRVPSYYDYATTAADSALGDADFLRAHSIGIDNLDFYAEDGDVDSVAEQFREALIRNMRTKGFYPLKPQTLSYTSSSLFKVSFDLPPGVPTGLYTVEAFLVKDAKVISKEVRNFQVGQVGFNAQVYLFANQSSLFYGVFAVLIAALTGWGAFTFLRRD
jgi:uncharacterized protein (TIGR02186 family)